MKSIAENNIWCCHGNLRMSFSEQDKTAEAERLEFMRLAFKSGDLRIPIPVALFAWKLLDVTEIWSSKKPNFLKGNQAKIERFHKSLSTARKKIQEISFVNNTDPQTKTASNVTR